MKRKLFVVVLALVMVLCLGLTLSACNKGGNEEQHTHTFATEWSNDADYHWHACTGDGCTEISDKASHTWNDGVITTAATETTAGVKTFTCTVCGKTKTEAITILSHVWQNDSEWTFDSSNHWHACSNCDLHKDEAAHNLVWQVISEATYRADGSKKQVCSICGYETEPVAIEKLAQETPTYTTPTGLTATYGDTLASVTLPQGFTFEAALTTSVGNAGTNNFTVSYTKPNDDEDRYVTVTGISVSIAVAPTASSVSNIQDLSKDYDGTAVSNPTFDKEGNGAVTFEWYIGTVLQASAPVNAGTYKVKVIVAATANSSAASAEKTFTIRKISGALDSAAISGKTYDGTAIAESAVSGILGDGVATYTWKTSENAVISAPTNAGSYKVTVSVAEGTNYYAASTTLNFTIEKADTTITTAPTQSGTNYVGQKLESVTLTGGSASVAGAFDWVDNTTVISSTSAEYAVVFTPTDAANYNTITANVAVSATQLTINVSVGENGTASVTGVQNVNYGSSLNVTFTPDSNKTVDEITVDDVAVASALNYQFSNITESHTLSVTFKEAVANYNLTLTVTDPDGKATVQIDGADKSSGFAATPYSYGNHTYIAYVEDNNYEIKSIKIAGVEQLPTNNGTIVLLADTAIDVTVGLKICDVTIIVSSWDGNYPCANELTIVPSVQQEYTKSVDIPFTISDGYTISQITCGSTYYDGATALAAGKIVLNAQNAATAILKIYVEPKTAKITFTKSYIDDDAKNCHDNSTVGSVYTAKFSDKLSCYVSWDLGRKAHIYKNGDTANDLYSTFFADRPESNTEGYSNYYIPYEAEDVAYEIVFYTEYNTITLTGEHVHLSLDGGTTAAVAPIKIIKYNSWYISVLADDGYRVTALSKDGADILSTLDSNKQFYIPMNKNTTSFTLAVTTERINYTLTVNNYKAEYFDTFKIYGKPTADGALTEKIGVVDTSASTMTYTFDWHEYVGKAEVTFAAAYGTWGYNGSCVYIYGTSFTGHNETTEALYSEVVGSDWEIDITAKIIEYCFSTNAPAINGEECVTVQYKLDDGEWIDGYYSNGKFWAENGGKVLAYYGCTLTVKIAPIASKHILLQNLVDNSVSPAVELETVSADGTITYSFIDVKQTYDKLYVNLDEETHTTTTLVKFFDGTTTTDVATADIGTYLNLSDGYCVCWNKTEGGVTTIVTTETGRYAETTVRRRITAASGYYVMSATYKGVALDESVLAGEYISYDFTADYDLVVVIAVGNYYKTVLTTSNKSLTMDSGSHLAQTRFLFDAGTTGATFTMTFNVPTGYQVNNIAYSYLKKGDENPTLHFLSYGTAELNAAVTDGITITAADGDVLISVYLAEDAFTDISTPEGFMAIRNNPDGAYSLTSDIDMSGIADAYFGSGVIFTGIFDGNGHTISNLKTSSPIFGYGENFGATLINTTFTAVEGIDAPEAILFRYLRVGTMRGVTMTATSPLTVGAPLAIWVGVGVIEDCHFTGDLVNAEAGLVVQSYQTSYIGCTVKGKITRTFANSTTFNIGGMVANAKMYGEVGSPVHTDACSTVSNCHTDVDIVITYADGKYMMYGWSTLGGMFGTYGAYDTTITNCSATGSITVNENVDTYSGFAVGGFAGWFCGDAQNCLSNVTITPGTNKGAFIGGFAGYLSNDSSFTNCAALGSIVYALNSSHVAVAGFATLNSVDYEYTFTNCLVLTSLNATTFTTALKDYSGDTPVAITVTASTIGTVGNLVAITDGHTKLTISGCSAYFDDSYNAAVTVTTTETVVTDSASATVAITTATASWSSEVWTIDATAGTVTLYAATAAWTE